MPTALRFAKMHGIGNDFVVVDAADLAGRDAVDAARVLCVRRFGVGSDGLLVIGPPTASDAAFSFRMHNPDGSPDMCGNGLRCAVLYAHKRGLVAAGTESFLVDTIDGSLQGMLLSVSDDGLSADVRVEMATPRLAARDIPSTAAPPERSVIASPIAIDGEILTVTALNTGSTHCVTFVAELPGDDRFFQISPRFEMLPTFPERTSLMWAEQTGRASFTIRIWERAAGETFGCGTGACAVAAAAILNGLAAHEEQVQVSSKGGTLAIDWPHRNGPLWLTGPARWVYEGSADLEAARARSG